MGKKQLSEKEKAAKLKEAGAEAAKKEGEQVDPKKDEMADDKGKADGHDDAEQDKALIQKMLDEYAGKAEEMDSKEREAMEGLAGEAYQAHKEMGKNEGDAYKAAGEALKLAKHMASKQAKAEAAKECGDEEKAKDEDKEKVEAVEAVEGDDKKEEAKKESATKTDDKDKKLLEANGRIAVLEAKIKESEVEKYVEGKLKTSGHSHAITKAFREAAGKITSTKDFDSKWSIFSEGMKRNDPVELDFSLLMEKGAVTETGDSKNDAGGLGDFSDCAE